MVPEVLPPYRNISSTPIPTSTASSILSKFLKNSESYPHLHPDAIVTPSGVSFGSHGPMGGVVIHNLRRVDAGLRGEFLEPERTPEPEDAAKSQVQDTSNEILGYNGAGIEKEGTNGMGAGAGDESWGWQNLSEYEREDDGVEVGEIGERNNFVKSGGDAPEVQVTGGAEEEQEEVEGSKKRRSKEDKEARKKAKKERNKEFKREKEKKKSKKNRDD